MPPGDYAYEIPFLSRRNEVWHTRRVNRCLLVSQIIFHGDLNFLEWGILLHGGNRRKYQAGELSIFGFPRFRRKNRLAEKIDNFENDTK